MRGRSFADGAAGTLRTWQRRIVPVDTRSPGSVSAALAGVALKPSSCCHQPGKDRANPTQDRARIIHGNPLKSFVMSVALLSIGTELTRGEIINTNATWLAAELTAAGFTVGAVQRGPR